MAKFDFGGWATKANLKCADGVTIVKDAFKENDGKKVPLVWNHQHDGPEKIIGHAILENRDEGVYAYCKLNNTEAGETAKILVQHGDIEALSIYANHLKRHGNMVLHGVIQELSVVLAGANPGAFIDSVIAHGVETEEEARIYTGEYISLYHADADEDDEQEKKIDEKKEPETDKKDDETVVDIFNKLNEEQKTAVYAIVSQVINNDNKDRDENPKGGEDSMKHNVFDQEETVEDGVLTHSQMETIITDAKRYGSLKESFLAHAADYGIDNIDYLFPEAKSLNTPPEFIKREMGWVQKVMGGVHHTPFSRIKSMFADITEDEARARGYIKGKLKKEEVFTLLKRTTTSTTIYKKQKLDRDDVTDITDFDVVAWLKSEMRLMLDEEIARAVLVGDGRLASSDDKIKEENIRPIWKDEDLYTIKSLIEVADNATASDIAREFIDQGVRSMKDYKGSGSPTCFTTDEILTECLLLKDVNGRRIYKDVNEIATAMRVKEIVAVPVMEGLTRTAGADTLNLKGIIVNLNDYNIGADKGGSINMFDDFDIDYNQQKYLIETRCSGALTRPHSAIALETKVAAAVQG